MKTENIWRAAMMLFVMLLTATTAWAEEKNYFDPTDAVNPTKTVDATAISSETTTLGSSGQTTWYYVSGKVTNSNRIKVSGTVNIILVDNCSFSASDGIHVTEGNALNIYAQSAGDGCGSLTASHNSYNDGCAAIGGNRGEDRDGTAGDGESSGAITIYGGNITVNGNMGGGDGGNGTGYSYYDEYEGTDVDEYGIGGNGGNSNVTIYGGNVTVNGIVGGGTRGEGSDVAGYYGGGTIHLSWTNSSDQIYASNYYGTVTLQKNFIDGDSNEVSEGDYPSYEEDYVWGTEYINPLDGKTLTPYDIDWTFDNGTLTISGTGAMHDYSYSDDNQPWAAHFAGITSVVICDGVTHIGNYVFKGCTNLATVTIPASVTSIGNNAFLDCNLTDLTIDMTTISESAFYHCTSLTTLTLGSNVETIGDFAFFGCPLTTVTIPNSVKTIGNSAFSRCTVLSTLTLGSSVETIGGSAFLGCPLITVTIPNSVKTIGDHVFNNCTSLSTLTLGSSVETIGESAFYGCTSLATVTIPNSVEAIGTSAFLGCTALSTLTLGNSVKTIGNQAFVGCTSLTTVTIPNSVKTIDEYAFFGCTSLKTVYVLRSESSDPTITALGSYAFSNCPLTAIYVHHSAYSTADNWSTYADKINLLSSCGTDVYWAYKDGVLTFVGTGAMNDYTSGTQPWADHLTGITSVVLSDGMTHIGAYAFYGCTNLGSVTIPASVETIGTSAFDMELIPYIDADGTTAYCCRYTVIDDQQEEYNNSGWFVVKDNLSRTGSIFFHKKTNFILADDTSLTINGAIQGSGNLTIYGQTKGTGTLTVTNSNGSGLYITSSITINGGIINATGTGYGIYSAENIVINGGVVTGTSTNNQNGFYSFNYLTINGGQVIANGDINGNNGDITLGWTNSTDYIRAKSITTTPNNLSVRIAEGKAFTDGTTVYDSNTAANDLKALTNVTLSPCLLLANAADNSDVINQGATLCSGEKQIAVALQGRTLYKDGAWNTLCLPFNVADINAKDASDNYICPLHGATVKTLVSSSFSGGTLSMNFTEDENNLTAIQAGVPYIVKWTPVEGYVNDDEHNIVSPVFTGVTVSNASANVETTYVDFIGTYSPVSIAGEDRSILFLGEASTLYYPSAAMTIKACRAYFQLNGLTAGDDPNAVRAFNLNFGDGPGSADVSSAIIADGDVRAPRGWYTLDGRKLDGKPTKSGLYIHGSKKVVIK